ncbi:MAG: hypothetical protein DMF50_00970 [Acidobacteria bacterium]|nr:MAG: hypothetical protein DMF50_00970 [Acidobacteriota bacterium]
MSDKVRRVDYYYVVVPDKPGEGARITARLKESGVNLLSLTAFPIEGGKSQIDFVPESPDAFVKAAKAAGLSLSPKKQALFIQGSDRAGAMGEIFKKLADAKVNVHSTNAACASGGGFGCILWVKPQDFAAAAKALGA